jgi:hypothetical protein
MSQDSPSSMQTPPSHVQSIMDPESRHVISVQPPSSKPIVDDPESPPVNSDVTTKNIEWQNIIMAFCFTTALGIALQSTQKQF